MPLMWGNHQVIACTEIKETVGRGETQPGTSPQHQNPFTFSLIEPLSLRRSEAIGVDQHQGPAVPGSKLPFDFSTRFRALRLKEIVTGHANAVGLTPATSNLIPPSTGQFNDLIVIRAGRELSTSGWITVDLRGQGL